MKEVNDAYVLPDPPSWHETITKYVKKIVTGFNKVFVSQKQETVRVSWND